MYLLNFLIIFSSAFALSMAISFFIIKKITVRSSQADGHVRLRSNLRVLSAASPSADVSPYIKTTMERINDYFREERPYLNPNLYKRDVADRLGINVNYVTKAISTYYNCNFSDYVNEFRVRYAMTLFRQNSDYRVNEVSSKCGFNNPTNFNRAFRHFTGVAPGEWKAISQQMELTSETDPCYRGRTRNEPSAPLS